jgi:cytidylate kinase
VVNKISIAIDGPSGAGKSTLSKALAKYFGLLYMDTGALYRAVGLFVHNNGIQSDNTQEIIRALDQISIELKDAGNGQRVFLNGHDVTDDIRHPIISIYASNVSAIKEVRDFLLSLQRDMAAENSVIMDGRDIGTVVLPNASIKIFLTAKIEERALRRYKELLSKGINASYEDVLSDMRRRDQNDSDRDIAPLMPAADAIILDTTGNSFGKSLKLLINIIEARVK